MNRLVARISVQLDYHPCTQFAGLHLALAKGLFAKRGLDVKLLPCSPVGGLEPELVCNLQRGFDSEDGGSKASVPHVAVGSVEQNVLIPAIARSVPCRAFGTIFQKSVLALGALPGSTLKTAQDFVGKTVAGHNDSQMELIQTLLSHGGVPATTKQVRQVLRANKMDLLMSGEVHAVQVYGLMEGLEIEAMLGKAPSVLPLEDLAATIPGFTLPLGYSQVLFSTQEALTSPAVRGALQTFMEVHEEGWKACAEDKEAAAEAVLEARAAAGIKEDQDRKDFQIRALEHTLPVVQGSTRIGAVSPSVWQRASRAMSASGYASAPVPLLSSLDPDIWPDPSSPAPNSSAVVAPAWGEVSTALLQEVSARARAFVQRAQRAPRVAVVLVGEAEGDALSSAGAQAGVEVQRVEVSGENVTFDRVHSVIAALNHDSAVDGIVLARPVGYGLDAAALGGCIRRDKDAGGESCEAGPARAAHSELSTQRLFQGSIYMQPDPAQPPAPLPLPPPWLLAGPSAAPPAVTATVEALVAAGAYDALAGARVVVVGEEAYRAALASELLRCGAAVSLCAPSAPLALLQPLCASAPLLLASPAAASSLDADLAAAAVTPSAASVEAALLLNVLRLAEARNRRRDAEQRHKSSEVAAISEIAAPDTWGQAGPGWVAGKCGQTEAEVLRSVLVCRDFNEAVDLLGSLRAASERVNHHPSLKVNPLRVCELGGGGCEVVVELTTFACKKITRADLELARSITALAQAAGVPQRAPE